MRREPCPGSAWHSQGPAQALAEADVQELRPSGPPARVVAKEALRLEAGRKGHAARGLVTERAVERGSEGKGSARCGAEDDDGTNPSAVAAARACVVVK
eukprot:2620550-Pleurochrysis_carterae.AAC.2